VLAIQGSAELGRTLVACLAIGLGLALAVSGPETASLTCEHGGDCTLTRGGAFGDGDHRFRADDMRAVELEQTPSRHTGLDYRVVIVTKAGRLPLTGTYTHDAGSQRALAKQIQAFIDGRTPRLALHDERTVLYWVGWLLVAVGCLFGAISGRRVEARFDAGAGELSHVVSWWGLFPRRRTVPFAELGGLVQAGNAGYLKVGIATKAGGVLPLLRGKPTAALRGEIQRLEAYLGLARAAAEA
jgi:hypothetical protein